MIEIEGVRPSSDIRAELAAADRPVLLAFSCGKDSIAAWLALRESGVKDIRPYCLQYIPGLQFVEESIQYFEDFFGTRIARYPHPSFYRCLVNLMFQPPERCAVIEAAKLMVPSYEEMAACIADDYGIPHDTWVADGVRANDSIIRRVAIKRHGPMKESNHKVSVVWDWSIADVREAIATSGVKLPIDYEWFGRSFDGIDIRFLKPIHDNAPEDYARILEWFPLAEMELFRHDLKR